MPTRATTIVGCDARACFFRRPKPDDDDGDGSDNKSVTFQSLRERALGPLACLSAFDGCASNRKRARAPCWPYRSRSARSLATHPRVMKVSRRNHQSPSSSSCDAASRDRNICVRVCAQHSKSARACVCVRACACARSRVIDIETPFVLVNWRARARARYRSGFDISRACVQLPRARIVRASICVRGMLLSCSRLSGQRPAADWPIRAHRRWRHTADRPASRRPADP